MRILFTTPVLEHPPAGGPALRIATSIKALNEVSKLYVLVRVGQSKIGGQNAESYFKKYCHDFQYIPSCKSNTIHKKISRFKANVKNRSLNIIVNIPFNILSKILQLFIDIKPDEKTDIEYIIKFVHKKKINVIWFGFGNISFELMKKLKARLPEVRMVCDTDSVWSRFILRELEVETDINRRNEIERMGRIKENEEREWTKFMDITTGVSEVDVDYYKSIACESSRIKLFSNVIDVEMYSNKQAGLENLNKPALFLAGTFWSQSPMEIAARWVINDIFPLVRKEIPSVHLYIVGKGSDKILSDIQNENITITGKVESVLPYLCNSDVALVPLKFESGTRFKILEAGICRIPIVSTTLGAEGLPMFHETHILIADNSYDFAISIVRLLKDKQLAYKITKNTFSLVSEHYTVSALSKQANHILNYITDN